MSLDQAANFVKVVVSGGYGSANTSIVLSTGQGALLPNPTGGCYNLVWWNATDYTDPADDTNVEIVRVTGLAGDEVTITRAQESTIASTKNNTGKTYKMLLGITAKMITDIQNALNMGGTSIQNEIVNGAGTSWNLLDVPTVGTVGIYGAGIRLTPGAGNDYIISGGAITTEQSYTAGSLLADYDY